MSDLTAPELEMALSLYRAQPEAGEPLGRWGESVCMNLGTDKDDLPMMLSRIEARGLIGRIILMGDGDYLTFPEGPYYKVGPPFERLMMFLER